MRLEEEHDCLLFERFLMCLTKLKLFDMRKVDVYIDKQASPIQIFDITDFQISLQEDSIKTYVYKE